MARTFQELTEDDHRFLAEYHLGTLTTLRPDGSPHVVAIAFTVSEAGIRIICSDDGQKVRNVERDARVAVTSVDGRRWLSFEGAAVVDRSPEGVRAAEAAYERRYRPVRVNPRRVVLDIAVSRVLGHA